MEIDNALINSTLAELYNICDLHFVKDALYSSVYSKLFLDGYINCRYGLYPNNKESLLKSLKASDSPFASILEANSSSYPDLYKKMREVIDHTDDRHRLTTNESQSILYALLQPEKWMSNSFKLCEILVHYYGSASSLFMQNCDFIVHKDISLIEITSLSDYIAKISELPSQPNFFFRGHPNINYKAVPSLYRDERYYKNEYMMYQELVVRCPDSFISCNSHLDFLVEMQHYGLPTRLLDVTSNPLIALYFACETQQKNVGEVVLYCVKNEDLKYAKSDEIALLTALPMLSYSKQKELLSALNNSSNLDNTSFSEFINEIKMERPSFAHDIQHNDVTAPTFVKPVRKNPRIVRQDGAFIVWGLEPSFYSENDNTDFRNIQVDKRYLNMEGKKCVFYINSKNKAEILSMLNRIGINKAYVYPEIDDVATYIKESML